MKLKELLWNAIDEWDNLLADWTQVIKKDTLLVYAVIDRMKLTLEVPKMEIVEIAKSYIQRKCLPISLEFSIAYSLGEIFQTLILLSAF